MPERPWFKFFRGDWRSDPGLRLCSAAARGVWIEVICLLYDGNPCGTLTTAKGEPLTTQQVARSCSLLDSEVAPGLAELEAQGVFSRDERGTIFSRKIMREADLSEKRSSAGRQGAFAKSFASAKQPAKCGSGSGSDSGSDSSEGSAEGRLLYPAQAWELARLHRDLLLKHNPTSSVGGKRWSVERWAKAYDEGQRTTAAEPIDWALIREALEWALDGSDPYWRSRATSPGAFFRSWDTITEQMNRGAGRRAGSEDEQRRLDRDFNVPEEYR
jgi:hypothetical protein